MQKPNTINSSLTAVDFPLRGEWVAVQTPAARVPSHGTDAYGQRYAYDLFRVDRTDAAWKTCRSSAMGYYLGGLPLSDFYAWGEPIHAPFDGTVIVASDGWPERSPVQFISVRARPVWDALASVVAGRPWDAGIAGNYVIVKKCGKAVYAFMAHLKTDSIAVRQGEEVRVGQQVGEVGQSGRSSEPHLHFHLMDRADLQSAKGLPCSFNTYEELEDGLWHAVSNGVPEKMKPIRSAA